MVNATLSRFVMARSFGYLLQRGQSETKSVGETCILSHEVQKKNPFRCPKYKIQSEPIPIPDLTIYT